MTKLTKIFCLCIMAACSGRGSELLDTPARVSSFEESLAWMRTMRDALPADDQIYFVAGFERFDLGFTKRLPADLEMKEKEEAFVTALGGMTPRQIILIGLAFFSQQLSASDVTEFDRASKHRLIVGAIRRYKKPPIQPVQHNAGSRPSSDGSSASETPSAPAPRG